MLDEKRLREAVDRSEIQRVVSMAIVARDSGLWEELAKCYHPDAMIATSWFSGSPAEFVKASQEMKIARHEGESQKHMTGNLQIELDGDRAVAECDLVLHQRRLIDGVELDFATWSRRVHTLERRDGEWRIRGNTLIYEKDRMDAVDLNDIPKHFHHSMDLSRYPKQVRYHCWRNDVVGFPPARNICLKGSERESDVRGEARGWIEGS